MEKNNRHPLNGRRAFLNNVTKIAGASMIMAVPGIGLAESLQPVKRRFTVGQVIDTILKEIPGAPFAKTVDQLRSGSLEQEVTGIVTTMFPTVEVIEKTAKAGANFIIAHETPFYNNEDQIDWLMQDDAYRYKAALLDKHKIAIWRFHDYWHAHKPDGIIMGNLIKLGWENHYNADNPRIITLAQPMPLQAIVALTKEKLGIPSVRVVGNLNQNCRTVYLAFGYMDSKRQIAAIQEYKPDLILSGETREWETVERVRDGLRMGQKTNLLVLSHAVSEEAGMEYAAKWLQPKVPGTRVSHIATGNPFQFV
ncbi:putative NIF3 family GTP cyclohydrolase 1 type 2 [Pontibacter ummariensis]|uniref:Putative GTP cyclohydrolase 1 type 2, NIF3 family n=1 Tax=Pontibacter ummariensis TaxID=1610492 RepID=A0A239KGD7_9BACT|nr:Nif3-like dinuclear metal center hexameric protein [Pontibacter ummariensis]PRY06410.1 putative NIF3 family GTP cyclohydrolase 1 type 2 [Pontibacter ummariensis]SNT16768.1 Putative GTP cyclohydrolase 1 type 2, NIF3 family [Pontibacter ummariensis]